MASSESQKNLITDESLAFLYKAAASRGPGKRQVRVVNRETLVANFGALGGVSDDEEDDDFKVEDESNNESDTDVDSENDKDNADNSGSDDNDDSSDEDNESNKDDQLRGEDSTVNNTPDESNHEPTTSTSSLIFNSYSDSSCQSSTCCICLNVNHVGVEDTISCDTCGLVVHESCYGIVDLNSDDESESSSELTEPWFCEPCLAGLNPRSSVGPRDVFCELCPNRGGAFKRTDTGRWVHLLCAYYNSHVTFGDVEKLTNVCLANLAPSQYGSRSCALCVNKLMSRAGLCVKCDAGMCKTYVHVTCGQRHGLLVDSLSANGGNDDLHNVNVADPYYVCCAAHSDRMSMKLKKLQYQKLEKQNVLYVQKQLSDRELQCHETKSRKFANLLSSTKSPPSGVDATNKQQRLMNSSYEFTTRMKRKTELYVGTITDEQWENEFRIGFTPDMVGKYVMPAAFSPDFVSYYGEREKFVREIANHVQRLNVSNGKLKTLQTSSKEKYDELDKNVNLFAKRADANYESFQKWCSILKKFTCKNLKSPDAPPSAKSANLVLVEPSSVKPMTSSSSPLLDVVVSVKSKKSSGGFAKGSPHHSIKVEVDDHYAVVKKQHFPILVTNLECATCRKSNDQHRLAYCDTCKLHYHLNCLDPPLTKMPRKTAIYGWECSTCSRKSTDSEEETAENTPDVNAPRQLRKSHRPVQRYWEENAPSSAASSRRFLKNRKLAGNLGAKSKQTPAKKLVNKIVQKRISIAKKPNFNKSSASTDDVIADVIEKAMSSASSSPCKSSSVATEQQDRSSAVPSRRNGVVLIKNGRVSISKRKPELVLTQYDVDVSSIKRAKLLQPGVGTALSPLSWSPVRGRHGNGGGGVRSASSSPRKSNALGGLDDTSDGRDGLDDEDPEESDSQGLYDQSKQSVKSEPNEEDSPDFGPKKRRNYDPSSLTNAIEAVMKGVMGPKVASVYYGVPRSTVSRRLQKAKEADRLKPKISATPVALPSQQQQQPRVVHHVIRVEDLE